jgi:predicted nucleotidyltransferase
LVAMNRITRFGKRIGEEFGAERVILFGSHAKGKATKDSDVDLLVIADFEGRSIDQSVKIRMQLRPGFPVDLLVRTPQMIERRLRLGDDFIKDIVRGGKVLYENHRR